MGVLSWGLLSYGGFVLGSFCSWGFCPREFCHTLDLSMWGHKMEKLLVTCNFSFSPNAFHSYISLLHQNAALCGNGFTK